MSKKRDKKPQEYDEWGDPVKAGSGAPQEEYPDIIDEWGDPVSYSSAQREKERVRSDRERILLEKELVEQGLIYPRAHYMPRGRARGIIACLLSFLFGMFVILGAMVGEIGRAHV